MKHLLVYAENLRAREARDLRKIMGQDFQIVSVLPIVSGPIHSEDQLKSMTAHLKGLEICSDRLAIVVACSEVRSEVMTFDEAAKCIKSHNVWRELLQTFDVESQDIQLRMNEHERCWVIMAVKSGGGIPPGMGFLVDKASGAVFPRRIADIISIDGNLI